jgi:hypothetical protein
MKKYRKMVKDEPIDIKSIRKQLGTKGPIKDYLDKYGVIRIGSFGDIKIGDSVSYNNCVDLMQVIHSYGYNYMLTTKSCHSIDDFAIKLIKQHNGILSVTCAFYNQLIGKRFEDVNIVPLDGRRRLIEKAVKSGINFVLRLNPIHPNFISDHIKMLEWYASIGGERVIFETIRILSTWKSDLPNVDFSKFVGAKDGGVYNGYITPPREMQDSTMLTMLHAANTNGITKVTFCGDMDLQDRLGYKSGEIDCCQVSEILGNTRPNRDWEEVEPEIKPTDTFLYKETTK